MESQSDSAHDQILNQRPVVNQLLIADSNDVVPHEPQLGVMPDVFAPLRPDMMLAIDLQHESRTEKHVDAMAGDPRLDEDSHAQPPQALPQIGLRPGIGERIRDIEQFARGARPRVLGQSGQRHQTLVERRLPRGQGVLERFAVGDDRENVLYRVGKGIGMPGNRGLRPVHMSAFRARPRAVRSDSDVELLRSLMHPELQAGRLRDARDHDACSSGGDEDGIRPANRDPSTADSEEASRRERALENAAADAELLQPLCPHDTAEVHDELDGVRCVRVQHPGIFRDPPRGLDLAPHVLWNVPSNGRLWTANPNALRSEHYSYFGPESLIRSECGAIHRRTCSRGSGLPVVAVQVVLDSVDPDLVAAVGVGDADRACERLVDDGCFEPGIPQP